MRIVVDGSQAGSRLDALIAGTITPSSRRRAQEAIAAGEVRVNGRRCRKGTLVMAGDVVEIAASAIAAEVVLPNPDLLITVLLDDDALIAVDKPAGLATHPLRASEIDTVANFLVHRHPQQRAIGPHPLEAGLVHRLDKDTSGVLLAARTQAAYEALRRQFRERSVLKRYVALVQGQVKCAGEVCAPLEQVDIGSHRVRIARLPHGGRPAVTVYRPLQVQPESTLLEVEIVTGVMHQIRAHLASIGHPVVGDLLYGGQALPGLARHFLHATKLGIQHPSTHEYIEIDSPLPGELRALL